MPSDWEYTKLALSSARLRVACVLRVCAMFFFFIRSLRVSASYLYIYRFWHLLLCGCFCLSFFLPFMLSLEL